MRANVPTPRRPFVLPVALLLLLMMSFGPEIAGRASTFPQSEPPPAIPGPCALCDDVAPADAPRPEAEMDAVGRRFADANAALFAATDSLYRAGHFGAPATDAARAAARAHFRLRCRTGLDYTVDLGKAGAGALDTTATAGASAPLLIVDETSLLEPFGHRYAGMTVYPLRFLARGVAGRDGFCVDYVFPEGADETSWMGGDRARVREVRLERDGRSTRALDVRLVSPMHKSLHLAYEPRCCGRVRRETIVDRGDTLELLTIDAITGMYARKAGTHRLEAIVLWRSVTTGVRDPEHPRLGACAYLPRIQLALPLFMPDIGLQDLRDFDVPQPILPTAWVRAGRKVDWLELPAGGFFRPWDAIGPRPEPLARRYPDL